MEAKLADVRDQLRHIQALLGATGEYEENANARVAAESASPPVHQPTAVCDIAARVLAERDKEPMRYTELAAEVRRRGGILNGAKPGQTLIAKLVKDDRFVRPKHKGFYALRSDYPEVQRSVGARTGPQGGEEHQ